MEHQVNAANRAKAAIYLEYSCYGYEALMASIFLRLADGRWQYGIPSSQTRTVARTSSLITLKIKKALFQAWWDLQYGSIMFENLTNPL